MVVFWKTHTIKEEKEDQEPVEKTIPVARAYRVFNVSQCLGLEDIQPRTEVSINHSADGVYAGYPDTKPELRAGSSAFYLPGKDQVHIPHISHFETQAGYYATLFHELIHSTGHQDRLNREGIAKANSSDMIRYAREELVAEMGAAFLCARTNTQSPELTNNSAAYLQGWLEVFRQDKTMIVKAASQAQKAVDYILGKADLTAP